jgi:hypothetical protein
LYHVCIKKCVSFNNNPSECVTTDQGRGYTCTLANTGGVSKCVEKCDVRSVPASHPQQDTPGPDNSNCELEPTDDYNCKLKPVEKTIDGVLTVVYSCLEVVDDELECSQITGYSECVGATKSTKRPEG